MNPTQGLTHDQAFFFLYAGYSYSPATETPEQGRTRGAIELAKAEDTFIRAYRVADVSCVWQDDETGARDARREKHKFKLCEGCIITINGRTAESLWSILDADDNYRRVIRAELALECLELLEHVIKENT